MVIKDINSNAYKDFGIEHWKEIEGFPGYEVSDQGRIRSFKSGKAKIKKQRLVRGYPAVDLYKNGERTTEKVHRLVAKAFLGKPDDFLEVNHKNGIKTDNWLENLEWVTRSENIRHADETGLRNIKGKNNPQAKLTDEEVLEILQMLDAGVPQWKIAEKFNVDRTTISAIKTGRSWSHLTGITPKNDLSKNPASTLPITVNINIYLPEGAI